MAKKHNLSNKKVGEVLLLNIILYITMEPCNERLNGNRICVDRILILKSIIKAIYMGIKEPGTFIRDNKGIKRLEEAGVIIIILKDMHNYIIEVSITGYKKV